MFYLYSWFSGPLPWARVNTQGYFYRRREDVSSPSVILYAVYINLNINHLLALKTHAQILFQKISRDEIFLA